MLHIGVVKGKPETRCQRSGYTGAYVFANVLLTMAGSAILLWGDGVVFIGAADCGRGCGTDRLGVSIMAAIVVIT